MSVCRRVVPLLFVTLSVIPLARAQAPHKEKYSKLTTPLAHLTSSVPQTHAALAPHETAIYPAFSLSAMPKLVRDTARLHKLRVNPAGQVQVYIRVDQLNEAKLDSLRAAGAIVERTAPERRLVQARVAANRLEAINDLTFVQRVRLPTYAVRNVGSATTEGDALLKTAPLREQLKVDGTGVRIGVISDGIDGVFAHGCSTSCGGLNNGPIATADLPDATGTRNVSGVLTSTSGRLIAQSFRSDANLEGGLDSSSGAEGTAMLEIVHDLAPGAQLYFANFETDLEFNAAVNWLASNTDVSVDDISFFWGPFDGTNPISANTAAALNNDANPLRGYYTSVGNFSNTHYRQMFQASDIIEPYDGSQWHLFHPAAGTTDVCNLGAQPINFFYLPSGEEATVLLFWDDPYGTSSNDYDLYLTDSDGYIVTWSTDWQDGWGDPVEAVSFQNTGPGAYFGVAISNYRNMAAPRNLNMFVLGATLIPCVGATNHERFNYTTAAASLAAEADAGGTPVSVVSVGAIRASDPGIDNIEFFSSQGPTEDGRLKPDVTGIDGVSVNGAGGFPSPFYGTSASAPHAAGLAALLLQSSNCLLNGAAGARTPADARTILYQQLTATAFDLGDNGADNIFGYGRLVALSAAQLSVPVANAGAHQSVNATSNIGAAVNLDGGASTDPHACPLSYSWSGDCGAAMGKTATLNCRSGVNNVKLSVTNNGVTFSPEATVQVVVTDFTVTPSTPNMTVVRGQTATYSLNIGAQYGEFTNPVTLSCSGLPIHAGCTFSPQTATPGSSSAAVTMSVTTRAGAQTAQAGNQKTGAVILALSSLGLAGIVVVGASHRRGARAMLLLLVAALGIYTSCGGGGANSPPTTPPGTYTLTVNGLAGALSHSTTVTLVVQ